MIRAAVRACGRAQVRRTWDGKLSRPQRHGAHRDRSEWDEDDPARRRTLPYFPGPRCRSRFRSAVARDDQPYRRQLDAATDASCELYSNLVTRPTGAAVRCEIEQQLDRDRRPRAHGDRLLARRADRFLLRRRGRREAAAAVRESSDAPRARGVLPLPRRERDRIWTRSRRCSSATARARYPARRWRVATRRASSTTTSGRRGRSSRSWAQACGADVADATGLSCEAADRMLDTLWRRRLVMRHDSGLCRRRQRDDAVDAARLECMMEGFQPWLMVSQVHRDARGRRGARAAGPAAHGRCKRRLLVDGELVWVYGPRRQELAVLRRRRDGKRGNVVARDIAGIAPARSSAWSSTTSTLRRSTRNLG